MSQDETYDTEYTDKNTEEESETNVVAEIEQIKRNEVLRKRKEALETEDD